MTARCLFVAAFVACGPGPRHDTRGPDATATVDPCPGCATVTGRVWAPRYALGDVPPGQEIPIFHALVYVTTTRPPPIPANVYCEACIDAPDGSTYSDHDGSFTLSVPPGHYWFVIQKGQFRIEREIDLVTGPVAFVPADTTLPHKQDGANGSWIPNIAIVYGDYDAVADILAKIGIGTLQDDKNPNTSGVDLGDSQVPVVTFYNWGVSGSGSAGYLLQHLAEMERYHIIFFPCSTAVNDTLLTNQTVLGNIRKYVAEGGKLYLTDWSGEVADRAFPPQIEFGDAGNDSKGDYDPIALSGTLTTAGTADGNYYTASNASVLDPDLSTWLGLQIGPDEDDPTPHLYTPNNFTIVDNWNWIARLSSHIKGTDSNAQPVYDDPKPWVSGSDDAGHGPRPLSMTYEPAGCGKVLYSTFQTSGADATESHIGLMPQERILLYLIMEISDCTQDPVIL